MVHVDMSPSQVKKLSPGPPAGRPGAIEIIAASAGFLVRVVWQINEAVSEIKLHGDGMALKSPRCITTLLSVPYSLGYTPI